MAKKWDYDHAAQVKRGLMKCACCGKPVTGWYRFRETDDAYVVQHRECTLNDPTWLRMDKAEADSRARTEALRQACIEFRAKWGVTELDEIIGDTSDAEAA